MRLPLEIISLVLSYAEEQFSFVEMVRLRLVNTAFDQQVLTTICSDIQRPYSGERFIGGTNLHRAPSSLQRKYVLFRFRRQSTEPSVFVHLLSPVLARLARDRNIADEDEERKNALLQEVLSLVVLDANSVWVIAHKSWRINAVMKRACPVRMEKNAIKLEGAAEGDARNKLHAAQEERRIEEDYRHARVCFAIRKGDSTAVSRVLSEMDVSPNRHSTCFGDTLFRFALRYGSFDVIRIFIAKFSRLLAPTSTGNQYSLICLAAQRADDGFEIAYFLFKMAQSWRSPVQRVGMLESFLPRACRLGPVHLVRALLKWVELHWNPTDTYTRPTKSGGWDNDSATFWTDGTENKKQTLKVAFENSLRRGDSAVINLVYTHVDIKDWDNELVLFRCAMQPRDAPVESLHLLLALGAGLPQEMSAPGSTQNVLLCIAASRGHMNWMEVLLELGADPGHEPGRCYHGGLFAIQKSEEMQMLLTKYGWDLDFLEVKSECT